MTDPDNDPGFKSGPDPGPSPQPGSAEARGPLSRRRLALAVLAGAIPLIPIIIALALSSGGTSGTVAAAAGSLYTPVAQRPAAPQASLPTGKGAIVARVKHSTAMRSRPGGRAYAKLPRRTEFGSPEALWVVRRSGRWLGVISPLAGNGKVGWILAADASLSRVSWELKVSLAIRRLEVVFGGHVVERYKVAIGAPASPTPTGRFAVSDRLRTGDPSGPYGCCILALTAKAPHAIQGWNGGDRIAIHSTPDAWTIGHAVSHGCVRLTLAQGRWLLGHIPLGTPALISS